MFRDMSTCQLTYDTVIAPPHVLSIGVPIPARTRLRDAVAHYCASGEAGQDDSSDMDDPATCSGLPSMPLPRRRPVSIGSAWPRRVCSLEVQGNRCRVYQAARCGADLELGCTGNDLRDRLGSRWLIVVVAAVLSGNGMASDSK
jgi:hypothetical protein